MYETVGRRSIFDTIEGGFFFDFFLQQRTRQDETSRTHVTTPAIVIVNLEVRDLLDFVTLGHGGSCNCGIPAQSLLFPITNIVFKFLKTPSIGSSPSISLNEMFKYFKSESSLVPSEAILLSYFVKHPKFEGLLRKPYGRRYDPSKGIPFQI